MSLVEPLRLTTYKPSTLDKRLAAFGTPLLVLAVWAMLAVTSLNSHDKVIRIGSVLIGIGTAVGAAYMAISGITIEEIILDGDALLVMTTRLGKTSERSYRLSPGCRASIEPVATVRMGPQSSGQQTAVILATDEGGSCWLAAGAPRHDKELVADQINKYLAGSRD